MEYNYLNCKANYQIIRVIRVYPCYSEEQIIGILKEAEAGIAVAELCRKYGISDQTYYNWKAKYGGSESIVRRSCY